MVAGTKEIQITSCPRLEKKLIHWWLCVELDAAKKHIFINLMLYVSVLLKKFKFPFLILEKFNKTYIGAYRQCGINFIFFG